MNSLARITASIGLLCATAACTTFGTNVSGAFRCDGPEGVCAPSVAIDDTALSQIQKSDKDELLAPAGPYQIDDGDPARSRMAALNATSAQPNQSYQLSVVFPAYTDFAGNVHARKTVAADVGLPGRTANSVELASRARGQGGARGLLAAAQSAPVAALDASPIPAAAPSVAVKRAGAKPAVEAAPIDRIKADVEARLSRARRTPQARRQAASFPSPE
ncbi:hypothetical protein [Novosphingobium gossypii]|uniref:hypothetical protein n=1 Tax=Novosphingobium gossypii TaxID=1604774 RepID=UPI003D1E0ECA